MLTKKDNEGARGRKWGLRLISVRRHALAALRTWVLLATPAGAQPDRLEPLAPVERELAPGQSLSFSIDLPAGQYASVAIVQHGIDVAAVLEAPDGAPVMESYGAKGTEGAERVFVIPPEAGTYRVTVRAPAVEVPAGRIEATLEPPREPAAADRSRVEAVRLTAEAQRLHREGSAESLRQAAKSHEQALTAWRESGNRREEVLALANLAAVLVSIGENQRALDRIGEAVPLAHDAGDRALEGRVLSAQGEVLEFNGQAPDAIRFYERALPIRAEAGDLGGQAETLGNLAGAIGQLGEGPRAMELHAQSLELYRRLHDRRGEAINLNNIGLLHRQLGDYEQALAMYRETLAVHEQMGMRADQANAHNNIGKAYEAMGDYDKAFDEFQLALPLWRAAGDRRGEAITLDNIGFVRHTMGDDQAALHSHEQALAIWRELGNHRLEAFTLDGLGVVHGGLGDWAKALALHEEALALRHTTGDRRGEGSTLYKLGAALEALGRTQDAAARYAGSLAIQQAVRDRAGEARALAALARLDREQGRLDEARTRIESALGIVESLRAGMSSPDLRATFQATKHNVYQLDVDVLMDLDRARPGAGFAGHALAAAERAKARSFLELLQEGRVDLRAGVEPDLLERERQLARRLNSKELYRTRLLGGKPGDERLAAVEKEVAELLAEHREVQADIRARSPRYAALTQPPPIDADAIQALLDDDTLLLEYALGEERSYVWTVTRSSLRAYELPPRARIETAARAFYERVTRSHRRAVRRSAELAGAELGAMVLAPLREALNGRRLLVVADGVLQYVPFAALPDPSGNDAAPLVVGHEVVSLPSASVLSALREVRADRPRPSRLVAVLSDPVFAADDPRVAGASRPPAAPPREDLTRSLTETSLDSLPRLTHSRREAEAILALAPPGQSLRALDFAASRATATDPALADYRIIHLASHGLLNSRHPELSGIVLSLVDEHGAPQDGFLRLHDVYDLHFGADLVVLSACQTALGQDVRGEGLVGLTRGFFYAGARGVVASLWSVRDDATAELMRRFYVALLRDGQRPSAAMRSAQVSLWKEARWRAPYHWAGFVVQGDWR
jgi:CHAT domain-containing protein/tetratricopeptide (TPR) repeat protein